MQPTEQIKQNSHNDQLLVIRWPIACPVAPEGDSSPCLGAGAFLVWVHESKLAGKTKYAVSSYFYISLYVRKQSSVLFPAPQPGEVGETGSRCRERQKEGRSKRSRKNNKKNPKHCFTLLCKTVHLGKNTIHSPSLSLQGYTTVSGINSIFLQHSNAAALTVL